MKKSLFLFALVLLVSVCSPALAQTPQPMGPPPVLLIVREDIKASKMPAHSKHSASFAQIFAKLQTASHRIALVPVAGSENEVVYLTGAGSFADLDKMLQDTDKKMSGATGAIKAELDRLAREAPDLHSAMRDILAVYRPELSYNPGVNIAQMRYFAITTVRVRPGQEDVYAEYVRNLTNAARDKAKAELHVAAFQVIAGSPSTTYLFFRSMKSLAEYDLRIGPRVREAMSDDQKKTADKLTSESVMVSETSVYAFEPSMSYVGKEMAAQDPSFWNPKPQKAAMVKKHVKKPAAAKPAGTQPPAKQ
ncbi:MAG TPA: hypothetical protein VHE60_09040 [Pyrinomonadaceae bacterium]|nr:hypothetical protein [Pyrinomonadaceae bacterium]